MVKYVCLIVLISFEFILVASYNLTMSPDHVRINKIHTAVSFTCSADRELTACQFMWWDRWRNAGPVLELSRGFESRADPAHLNASLTGYSYSGRGLRAGDCGITLQVEGWKIWTVVCRVRAATGGWMYAWSDLNAYSLGRLPTTLARPREAIALPGGEAKFLLKAQEPLSRCRFHLPGVPYAVNFIEGAESNHSTGRHLYFGAGLQSGECGLLLTNISEADNGPVRTYSAAATIKDDYRVMVIIVARPPTAPTLSLVYTGNNVTATCEVKESRPLAKISWVLGNDLLHNTDREDVDSAGHQEEWALPWVKESVVQTITHRLQPEDNGKNLNCRVSHVTLDRPLLVTQRISLTATCPPVASKTVDYSCTFAGEEVNCSQPQMPGARAGWSCKPGFLAADDIIHDSMHCRRSGEWEPVEATCSPDCGRRNSNDGDQLVAGGAAALVGEFPWVVAVYEVKSSGFYYLLCSGSLISTRFVISAAHCFWNNQDNIKKNASYHIAVGKLRRDWDEEQIEARVQRREVGSIMVHHHYHGRETRLQNDIALLKLKVELQVTAHVNLVCVDWNNRWEESQLQPGSNGTVAGWGFTENGTRLSDHLRRVALPYVEHQACYDALEPEVRSVFTSDKFCAGFVGRDIGVCRGDSGGGLVYLREATDKYYIRGIVSNNFRPFASDAVCFSEFYIAFTRVSDFLAWIKRNAI